MSIKLSRYVKFIPLMTLVYFHQQKAKLEDLIGNQKDLIESDLLLSWYKRTANRIFVAVILFTSLPIAYSTFVSFTVYSIIVVLITFSIAHNYSELYLGILIKRKISGLEK